MSDGQVFKAGRWSQLWLGVVCMILTANLQYAWTLFVPPMHAARHWSLGGIQAAFAIFVALETWFTPVAGWIADHAGPRRGPPLLIAGGGVLVAIAWVIDSYALTLGALYLGAVLSGVGAGAVYATCVGNAVKWFPDRRGLAAGLTAAGFGAGAALTVVPVQLMIARAGYQTTFFWFGLGQGALLLLMSPMIRAPLAGEVDALPRAAIRQSRDSATPAAMLRSPLFWLLYVMFVLVSASGLMATAQLAPIARDFHLDKTLVLGATVLGMALVIDSVANGLARAFFGWVSDRIGREVTMAVAFTLGAVSYGLFWLEGHTAAGFIVSAALIFFTWGEIFSLFPSTCTDLFGTRYASTNASLLYTAKGVSALLVPAANVVHDATGSWQTIFLIAAGANLAVAFSAVALLLPAHARLRRAEALA